MHVVDLFAGMGGLSLGFKLAGFNVTGYERDEHALATYRANVGPAFAADLSTERPAGPADVVVGGPPCRPWSPINLQRRRAEHDDYALVRAFDRTVLDLLPKVFVLENVPFLRGDSTYQELVGALSVAYELHEQVVRYSDWGAATKRRRLFVIGTRRDAGVSLTSILLRLDQARAAARTVRSAIGRLASASGVPDHEWSEFKTIAKYRDKYVSQQYGWYQLDWEEPAPSFGNVAKTYTLHPDGSIGNGARVLSPREVMALLGFPDSFVFPASVPRSSKYRMVADAVSPTFGRILASAIDHEIYVESS